MITIVNAIDYATDHGVRVSEEYLSKVSRTKAVSLANTYIHVEIRQLGKGSIVEAVNQITRETERLATLDE